MEQMEEKVVEDLTTSQTLKLAVQSVQDFKATKKDPQRKGGSELTLEQVEEDGGGIICYRIKSILCCLFVIILVFSVFALVIAYEAEVNRGTTAKDDSNIKGNVNVCGADNFMLRDGVCDEPTNNELCHWDGGDCCLDKTLKDDTLCQDCNCKWTTDDETILEFFKEFNVKRLRNPLANFEPVHLEKTVLDTESKQVCDAVCTHPDLDNVVNAWSFQSKNTSFGSSGICTCAWLTSLTCDWNPITIETDNGLLDESLTIAYIQLSKTLACDCQEIHYKYPIENTNIVVKDKMDTLSSWHCQKECQSNQQCQTYSWDVASQSCMIIAFVDDGTESIVDIECKTNWISGGADCSGIKDFMKKEERAFSLKLVITGGHDLASSEVFEISDSSLKVCQHSLDLPVPLWSPIGNVLTKYIEFPIICGGHFTLGEIQDDCYILGNDSPEPFGQLSAARSTPASVLMPGGKTIWATGGRDGSGVLEVTDYISWETSTLTVSPGHDLPFRIAAHCMINLDDKAILLIGGRKGNGANGEEYMSDQTWQYNLTSEHWTQTEAALNYARDNFVCGLVQDSGLQNELVHDRSYLILLGGLFAHNPIVYTDTIEQMEISLQGDVFADFNANVWTVSDQKLPTARSHMASAITPDRKTLIVAGGYPYSTDILWFKCMNGKCEYENDSKLKLQTKRFRAVAIILTNTNLICED